MNDKPLPPVMRLRDVLKLFGGAVDRQEIRTWEECNLIHPLKKNPNGRRLYYRHEMEKILNGQTT